MVNGVFASHPDGFVDFENHLAHHQDLPGYIEALPLVLLEKEKTAAEQEAFELRNPLLQARDEADSGAREGEAALFAEKIAEIVAQWSVLDKHGKPRRASYGDIMVLVRKRTHLRTYEAALREKNIPFLTSRRGGLLDTLEAEDIQALLLFLIAPFADLQLAQVLRSPIFSCADEDLMQLAALQIETPVAPTDVGRASARHAEASAVSTVGVGLKPDLQPTRAARKLEETGGPG